MTSIGLMNIGYYKGYYIFDPDGRLVEVFADGDNKFVKGSSSSYVIYHRVYDKERVP